VPSRKSTSKVNLAIRFSWNLIALKVDDICPFSMFGARRKQNAIGCCATGLRGRHFVH
jgi:hypothetical protein